MCPKEEKIREEIGRKKCQGRNSRMMINILSQVVELRNGESGLHVQHIQILTGILLERVA